MTHIMQAGGTRKTYHGGLVRVDHRGTSLDGTLVVQKLNPLTGDWLDHATFYQSADYCYSEAASYAGSLACKS